MTIDERLGFLVQSQESLGRNIEKLYESVSQQAATTRQQAATIQKHEEELQRFRRAMRAALEAWLDNNGQEGSR